MSYHQPAVWKYLNLATRSGHPHAFDLVALRLVPLKDGATFYREERYDIGTFEPDEKTGRKLWWHGTRGIEDPCKLQKKYEITWYPIDMPE